MIKVLRSGFLTFYKNKFKCSFGKNGFTKNKREGDRKTPIGNFKIVKCYYRSDKIQKPLTKIKCIKITKDLGWCDDPRSRHYNKVVTLPFKFSYEKLYRSDYQYDLVLVLNYNMNPVIKNKGSAIFIHIAKQEYKPTNGCIGLKKKDLFYLLRKIKKNVVISIA